MKKSKTTKIAYLRFLQILVLKIPYIIGFAAELSGARLWKNDVKASCGWHIW